MKQAESAAHSSGRKGGDSLVLDRPLIGVLHMMATATVLTGEAIGSLLGGLAALRLRPGRPMLVCVLVFTLSSIQLVLLAEGAPFGAIAVAASIAGFAFAFGGVIYETALQRWIARQHACRRGSESSLHRPTAQRLAEAERLDRNRFGPSH